MHHENLISVIIPIYNVDKYLGRCLDTLLHQSFTEFELILIDDGSTDKSGEIAEKYARLDERIVVIHQENGGLSAARNTGIEWSLKYSSSKWITFIDSDDWVHEQYLEFLYRACTECKTKLALCCYQRTTGAPGKKSITSFEAFVLEPEDLWCNYQGTIFGKDNTSLSATVAWGKLYAKDLWQTLRYPNGKLHEDEYTTYKIVFQLEKIAVIPIALLYYFQNSESIVGMKWNPRRLDAITALEEQVEYYEKNQFNGAALFARRSYFDLLKSGIMNLKEIGCKKQAREYKRKFRRVLIGYLKKNRPFEKYEEDYMFAFPMLCRGYLYIRSALNKLPGKRKNENKK